MTAPVAAAPAPPHARLAFAILAVAALLRLGHLGAALRSPTTWNPGPDEDFYLQFARHVAGGGGVPVDFAFMDPLYGWLAGGLFLLVGPSIFALYLLQAAVDVGTAALLWRCGVALRRPSAGLLAAALYATCATAVMFTATALKATWVAAFVALWTLAALRALDRPSLRRWLALGLLGGLAVGLRSNLLLVAAGAIVLLPVLLSRGGAAPRVALAAAGWLLAGTLAGLAPWAALGARAGLGVSPVPYNGGVVLHHLYNADNPEARSTYPSFVAYRHPLEIWRGYRAEAERRTGRAMSPRETSAYWRAQAIAYVVAHPGPALRNAARKLGEFVAWPEVPNNRSFEQERLFSPVLRWLPAPFPWLLALGLPGLLLLLREDHRAPALWLPLLVCVATVMAFFAEDRFRFHAVPTLALGTGLALERAARWIRERRLAALAAWAATVLVLVAASFALARHQPPARLESSRVAWGWLRMGEVARAADTATAALQHGERDAALHEVLAAIALHRQQPAEAVPHLRASLALRPRAHATRARLAEALAASGAPEAATEEWESAIAIRAEPAYLEALAGVLVAIGREAEALVHLRRLATGPDAAHAARARAQLERLCANNPCPAPR